MALEMENCFLSTSNDDKKRLTKMLRQVMDDLNCHRISIITGKGKKKKKQSNK